MNHTRELTQIYDLMFDQYGSQNWWPGETIDEIIIGAILTQNTSWNNVETAIDNLKTKNLLSLRNIFNTHRSILATCIRPSGYYNQKALRLKEVAIFFHNNDITTFREESIIKIRNQLLSIKGIGPETADSIILYAFEKPIFVIDAYTRRIFNRLALLPEDYSYDKAQNFFMKNLVPDTKLFNEYHALIVRHAKECCQKIPQCSKCVLSKRCNSKI